MVIKKMGLLNYGATLLVIWQAGNDNFDVGIMVTVVASCGVARSCWSSYCNYFG